MSLNYYEYAALHDIIADITNISLNEREVEKLMALFPLKIIGDGQEFGFNDTVVKDDIHVFCTEYKDCILSEIRAFRETK